MKVKSESEVAQSCPTLSDLMDCSLPGSSVHGISRQEYWSGVPLPSLILSSSSHLSFLDDKLRTEMVRTLLKETHCIRENGPQIKALTVIPTTAWRNGCGMTWGGGEGGVSYHGEVPIWPACGNIGWISLNEK